MPLFPRDSTHALVARQQNRGPMPTPAGVSIRHHYSFRYLTILVFSVKALAAQASSISWACVSIYVWKRPHNELLPETDLHLNSLSVHREQRPGIGRLHTMHRRHRPFARKHQPRPRCP